MRPIIAVLLSFLLTQSLMAQSAPNVLVIFIDDMGWADLSCFGGTVQTPNIDRLASEGLRFRSFYVNSPICSPSRTALTTGNFPARHRITSFLANRRENNERAMPQWLDPSVPTLAKMLKARGYATGHFGKWHMGGQRDVGEAPLITEYGFDESLTNFEGLGPRVLPLNDAYDGQPAKRYSLGSEKLDRGTITWVDRNQVTRKFVEGAMAFIDKAAANNQPWMINLWPDDVHSPFFPPEGKRGDGKKRTLYYNVLANMDQQLGVLLDRIRNDARLRDNTIILFASDNGPEPGAGRSDPCVDRRVNFGKAAFAVHSLYGHRLGCRRKCVARSIATASCRVWISRARSLPCVVLRCLRVTSQMAKICAMCCWVNPRPVVLRR